jgi:hypothetical protein
MVAIYLLWADFIMEIRKVVTMYYLAEVELNFVAASCITICFYSHDHAVSRRPAALPVCHFAIICGILIMILPYVRTRLAKTSGTMLDIAGLARDRRPHEKIADSRCGGSDGSGAGTGAGVGDLAHRQKRLERR